MFVLKLKKMTDQWQYKNNFNTLAYFTLDRNKLIDLEDYILWVDLTSKWEHAIIPSGKRLYIYTGITTTGTSKDAVIESIIVKSNEKNMEMDEMYLSDVLITTFK